MGFDWAHTISSVSKFALRAMRVSNKKDVIQSGICGTGNMVEFESLFRRSAGKPIAYNGEVLMMADKLSVPDRFKLSIILLSTHSEWQQAIKFKTKGKITSKNSGIESHCFMLWEKDLKEAQAHGERYEYDCISKNNELMIWNAWEDDKGDLEAWVRGAAMKKEVIAPHHFRYYCNDGHIDDNFDALIFDIIIE